jgi:sugar lactone lactonase YvrE
MFTAFKNQHPFKTSYMKKLYPLSILSVVLAALLFTVQVSAQITTVAGRHFYLGDNGIAANAGFFGPYAMASDTSGNLYIVTYNDNRVRKIDASTKLVTTIAGTGVAGYSGDGGLATAAQLNFYGVLPGIAVDKSGNVFIGDYGNNRVRKIDATTHKITTIAGVGVDGYSGDGGVAVAAQVSGPAGIAVDTAGNVYFADNNNSVIRKITVKTGKISTVAGDNNQGGTFSGDGSAATAAGLNNPERIALDAAGNIYIADQQNLRIRKVTAATGIINTIAGNGLLGATGDGGAATSAALGYIKGITLDAAGNIYLADPTYHRVRKITVATQKISTIAGTGTPDYTGDGGLATSANLHSPSDVLVDKSGNILIDDNGNNVLRKIATATGIITTAAGDGTDGFTGVQTALQAQITPQALTFSPNGDMVVADGLYYDVRAVNTVGAAYIYAGLPNPDPKLASKGAPLNGVLASTTRFNAPVGIAADANNNIYIADVFNNTVRVINYGTKFIYNYAGTGTAGYSGDNAAATAAKLNAPYGIALDSKGNLYIADALNNSIRKVDASTKIITTIAGTGTAGYSGDNGAATSATLNFPYAVAADASGNIFIVDRGNKKVRKITAATGIISTILNNGHVLSGIATDASGNIYVSDSTNSTIIRIDKTSFSSQVVAGNGTAGYTGDNGAALQASLNNPKGLYIDSHNYIYVADAGNSVIRKIIMGTLPVNFSSFTVQKNKNTILLQWSTATETNNSYFNIERRSEGTNWQPVGTVQGQGNSTSVQNYSFTDATPANGGNYYRIKQVDADGNFSYSAVRFINITGRWSVNAYPNPVISNLVLEFNNEKNETATIVIYNMAGKAILVKQQPVTQGFNHIVLSDVQTLAQGTYFIKLVTRANNYQSKFIRLGK